MIKGLPEKLKKCRENYSLSQKTVAKSIGVSPSIISAYETGERTPSIEILLALSNLYHCTTDYLLGKNNEEPTTRINSQNLSSEQVKLINALIDTIKHKKGL